MLLAQVLIIAALLTWLLPQRWHLLAIVIGLSSLLPLPEVSPAMALRGLWGDPSITGLQLLVLFLLQRPPAAFAQGWRGPLLIALLGAAFYPLALGLGDWDPYRLGYQPIILLPLLAAPALVAWWRGQAVWLWLLAVDLLAWAAGLLESPNLWDTLLDPLLALACLFLAARNGWRSYKRTP